MSRFKINRNLVLIGPMGAGKTTIGRHIAQVLHFDFYDSDREIEERTGASIPLIFELEGEAGFRKREQEVIRELVQKKCIVLATGGGVVLNEKNRQALKRTGVIVYLHAEIEQLLERTSKDKNRPLLQTADPEAKLREIITVREPLYRGLADIILETNRMSVNTAVAALEDRLHHYDYVQ